MPIGLAAVISLFTILWRVPLAVRNSSIVDIWWGPAVLLIGITPQPDRHHDAGYVPPSCSSGSPLA